MEYIHRYTSPSGLELSSELYQMDCMQLMSHYPDKHFDLAVVDPPYGINAGKMNMGNGKNKKYTKGKKWDNETPCLSYFLELFRVSKEQIVWGGNYFADKLPITNAWIFWDKLIAQDLSFSDGELAWSSYKKVLKKAEIEYSGFRGQDVGDKIHPTQKPVALYDWIFNKYANIQPGMKILDTHLGSGSSRISAYKHDLNFVAAELDEEYCQESNKRYLKHTAQCRLF